MSTTVRSLNKFSIDDNILQKGYFCAIVEVQSGGFMIALRLDDCFGAWSAVATPPKESDAEMSDQQSTNSKITRKSTTDH